MTGRPQRQAPKESIHLHLDSDVLFSVLPLFKCEGIKLASKSQLVEAILFLSEHMHIEEPDQGFILKLAEHKFTRTREVLNGCKRDVRRFHLTLDRHVIAFADMLAHEYRILFSNRDEAIELMLYNVGVGCDTTSGVRYYGNRIREVLRLHPKHKR